MQTTLLIIFGGFVYALFGIAVAKASLALNSNLVTAIANGIGMIIPFIVYFVANTKKGFDFTREGMLWSLAAGVLVTIFSMILPYIFSKAENVSFVMPLAYGATIVFGVVLGALLLKEQVSLATIVGTLLIVAGVGCIIYARLHS